MDQNNHQQNQPGLPKPTDSQPGIQISDGFHESSYLNAVNDQGAEPLQGEPEGLDYASGGPHEGQMQEGQTGGDRVGELLADADGVDQDGSYEVEEVADEDGEEDFEEEQHEVMGMGGFGAESQQMSFVTPGFEAVNAGGFATVGQKEISNGSNTIPITTHDQ